MARSLTGYGPESSSLTAHFIFVFFCFTDRPESSSLTGHKLSRKGTNLSSVRVLTWPGARKAKGHGPVVINTL